MPGCPLFLFKKALSRLDSLNFCPKVPVWWRHVGIRKNWPRISRIHADQEKEKRLRNKTEEIDGLFRVSYSFPDPRRSARFAASFLSFRVIGQSLHATFKQVLSEKRASISFFFCFGSFSSTRGYLYWELPTNGLLPASRANTKQDRDRAK